MPIKFEFTPSDFFEPHMFQQRKDLCSTMCIDQWLEMCVRGPTNPCVGNKCEGPVSYRSLCMKYARGTYCRFYRPFARKHA